MRFSLTRAGDAYRLRRRGPSLEMIEALISFLLAQEWSEPEFVLRLSCGRDALARLGKRIQGESEVVLTAAELHILYCVLATPRLMITSERAFWERFGFYRETSSTAYFGLVRVAGELDGEPADV